jgi:hypothetical protein
MMKVDTTEVKMRFRNMSKEEILEINKEDLTEGAKECYDQELKRRNTVEYKQMELLQEKETKHKYEERQRREEEQLEQRGVIRKKGKFLGWIFFISIAVIYFVFRISTYESSPTQPLDPFEAGRMRGSHLGGSFFIGVGLYGFTQGIGWLVAYLLSKNKK